MRATISQHLLSSIESRALDLSHTNVDVSQLLTNVRDTRVSLVANSEPPSTDLYLMFGPNAPAGSQVCGRSNGRYGEGSSGTT